MPAEDRHDREAARSRIFDAAQTLATALLACHESERWEPLRDLILAGLQAGGLRHPDASTDCVRTASSELAAAALDARRQRPDQTGTPARRPAASSPALPRNPRPNRDGGGEGSSTMGRERAPR
jgi:hypothetical protein